LVVDKDGTFNRIKTSISIFLEKITGENKDPGDDKMTKVGGDETKLRKIHTSYSSRVAAVIEHSLSSGCFAL